MTKNDFASLIENGSDIMFSVMGKNYTILTWTPEGIAIGEQHPNDNELQYYNSPIELLDGFTVEGIPLGELSHLVKITEYA